MKRMGCIPHEHQREEQRKPPNCSKAFHTEVSDKTIILITIIVLIYSLGFNQNNFIQHKYLKENPKSINVFKV